MDEACVNDSPCANLITLCFNTAQVDVAIFFMIAEVIVAPIQRLSLLRKHGISLQSVNRVEG